MLDDSEFKSLMEHCPEVTLFVTIEGLGGFIWRMNHGMNRGDIPVESHPGVIADCEKMQEKMTYAVDQTSRFGVTTPRHIRKSHITGEEFLGAADDYWRWYRWWDKWYKALTNDDFRKLDKDLMDHQNGQPVDLSCWRPDGDWRKPAATATEAASGP